MATEMNAAVGVAVGQYRTWKYRQQQAAQSERRLHDLVARLGADDFAEYADATAAIDGADDARELARESRGTR